MLLGEFEPFCERYQDGMYLVAKSVLHNDVMAEDAVQIALTRIFKLFGRLEFADEKQEKAYVLRAAQNVAIDIRKQEMRFGELSDATTEDRAIESGDTAFKATVAQEIINELSAVVNELSPKTQAIFKFRELGLKDAEIADTLGISVSDVRTTVFRARRVVSAYLKERGLFCE